MFRSCQKLTQILGALLKSIIYYLTTTKPESSGLLAREVRTSYNLKHKPCKFAHKTFFLFFHCKNYNYELYHQPARVKFGVLTSYNPIRASLELTEFFKADYCITATFTFAIALDHETQSLNLLINNYYLIKDQNNLFTPHFQ